MNPAAASAFADLYFASASIALVAVLLRLTERPSSGLRLLSGALVIPLVIIYLIGMHRIAGTDYENYLAAYTGQAVDPIPDLGYNAVTWFTREIGISFSGFQLLQGIFTLIALWLAATRNKADAVIVIAIYLFHLAIVRDLSQSRIGLAVAVYLLAQTSSRWPMRTVLNVAAISIHFTVIVLVLAWAYARLTERMKPTQRIICLYVPLVVFCAYGEMLLDIASSFDARVAFYLSWDEEGYGAPITSFNSLWRVFLVASVYLVAMARFKDIKLRPYLAIELMGAAIIIGFSQYSIFSARFSNVVFSMYPLGLGIVARAYQARPRQSLSPVRGFGIKFVMASTLVLLLVRPGSFDALREVVPTAFVWDAD